MPGASSATWSMKTLVQTARSTTLHACLVSPSGGSILARPRLRRRHCRRQVRKRGLFCPMKEFRHVRRRYRLHSRLRTGLGLSSPLRLLNLPLARLPGPKLCLRCQMPPFRAVLVMITLPLRRYLQGSPRPRSPGRYGYLTHQRGVLQITLLHHPRTCTRARTPAFLQVHLDKTMRGLSSWENRPLFDISMIQIQHPPNLGQWNEDPCILCQKAYGRRI
jgi:hypothetical protein